MVSLEVLEGAEQRSSAVLGNIVPVTGTMPRIGRLRAGSSTWQGLYFFRQCGMVLRAGGVCWKLVMGISDDE